MDTEEVSVGIEQLVDHLRTNRATAVTLGDIAGVTEVLLGTMQRYFNSIDTTLYSEFRGLSSYIDRARGEIAELRPNDLKQEKLPRAGLELDAIVASTEEATGTIMDAAEEIMAADQATDEYGDVVNDACMRIFEACSFQDITGQRINKVVATLTYIEERLHGLQDAWGPDIVDAEGDAQQFGMHTDDDRPDQDLLNGPALDGQGIEQSEIDELLSGDVTAEAPVESIAVESVSEEMPAPDTDTGTKNGVELNDTDLNGSEDKAEPGADVDQDDIDAMFDSVDDAVTAEPEPKPKIEVEAAGKPEPKAAAIEADAPDVAPDVAADDDQPELDDIVPLTADMGKEASQDDIDAMFD
ncbi:MAG: hypothetical protein HOK21_01880 [Rhodospirillaceae bacterium]|jgi:hypothetical protein|nr:hypothetical protein [Rhodospirillaceae bacterium]MBT4045937.1 hypothetical protein [Rhodospirillaceae bacterium]MBT4687134.1 hypothetical protein [Rhodospirillaceae bacterium]MBT5081324.1 hypothetical protein [Rhodospirillaceae bacterium]MBT5522808.1 hypothetical protein [Rhodospirillaceae bacterium]